MVPISQFSSIEQTVKKLKLDLFEKRYAIYIAIVMFLSEVVRTIKIEKKQQINFIENTRGAEFLFDADIKKYIDQIWEKAVDLETWSYDHNTSEHSGKRAETMKWLIKQLDEIDQRFKKYMQLSH